MKRSKPLVSMADLKKVGLGNLLRSGNLVLLRDGTTGIVVYMCSQYYIMYEKEGTQFFRALRVRYNDELLHVYNDSCDIMKVIQLDTPILSNKGFKEVLNNTDKYVKCNRITVKYQRKELRVSLADIAKLYNCDPKDIILI